MVLKEQEANRPWYQRQPSSSSAALENVPGLEPPDNDELERETTYQVGMIKDGFKQHAEKVIIDVCYATYRNRFAKRNGTGYITKWRNCACY